jgi:phosphoglucosamine mutase
MGKLFGTDGVRGVAGRDLDARLMTSIAAAAATVLAGPGPARPVAVVGRDPRASGEFLEAAVVAGLAGRGVDVLRLGVLPTPALAYLTDATAADFGVMLSASHNPASDNGIKFFARGGLKLPDHVEDRIEAELAAPNGGGHLPAAGFGRVSDAAEESGRYLAHVLSTVESEAPLAGMRVVVDCAHGAAYRLAPRLFREAGAHVTAIGVEPDGDNINSGCGSTSLGALRAAVVRHGADAGIAFDGDADRCLAVDAAGEVVDGDQILAVLALDMKQAGRLAGNTVVATVMANLGFRLAMAQAGIDVVETPVGDRYLLAAMLDGKFVLGGEQSGHIIMLDHATTGDGLLTGIQLLATVAQRRRALSDLASVMTKYPQVLVNVHVADKARVVESADLAAAVAAASAELGDAGRVLVRPSGTEPAVRVMVEAVEPAQARRIADQLAGVVHGLG